MKMKVPAHSSTLYCVLSTTQRVNCRESVCVSMHYRSRVVGGRDCTSDVWHSVITSGHNRGATADMDAIGEQQLKQT